MFDTVIRVSDTLVLAFIFFLDVDTACRIFCDCSRYIVYSFFFFSG